MPDNDIEQRIRQRAFYIWIEQGRPEGKDKEHWQQAESELMAGIAKPESELHPARDEVPQAGLANAPGPEVGPAQAAPGVEAIGQIRYAAARDVDQGGDTRGQRQFQFAALSWNAYRRY
jgi:hypothetical protein